MPDIELEVLAFVESVPGIDEATATEVRDCVDAGEHGIALAELVAWALRSRASADVTGRLARLVETGGFPEDLAQLRRYARDLERGNT